jgi:DNA mismatch endonuclease, patch repair protein
VVAAWRPMSTSRSSGSWASSEGARRTMLANRRVDTKPEVALRSALHRLGLRFRKDFRIDLPSMRVRPDVVFGRARVAVYCDGCFWHRCPMHATSPKANADYWRNKLAANVRRDREADYALAAAGWRVIRVWEHEDPIEAAKRIEAVVRS